MELGEHLRKHSGVYAIGALVTAVSAIEILSPQTISTGFDRILDGEYGQVVRAGVIIGSLITFCHTLNITPKEYDPIQAFGDMIPQGIERFSL